MAHLLEARLAVWASPYGPADWPVEV